jgi:glycosyltransferase involved in cell wall biosynthesis
MRIAFYLDVPTAWKSGIWYHRIEVPARALSSRGHGINQLVIGDTVPDNYMEYPNTVIFGRIYPEHTKPIKVMMDYKKQGKRVLYDMDDDYWAVDPDNPSRFVSNVFKDQYEELIREADALTTPSRILAKKMKRLTKKPVFLCPNGIDFEDYLPRPKEHHELLIGYMGAASHWRDVSLVIDVLNELNKKYDFTFVLYGMTGEPLEAAMHHYNRLMSANLQPEQNSYFKSALDFYKKLGNLKMYHIPFYPPELHPSVLGKADFDIGLAPLDNNEFSRGKSCIKFYEYAAVGTPTLASDVEPYKSEVNYRAKNTFKDWYNKLEKLIVDEKFRQELAEKQHNWVKENRSLEKIGLAWEVACQKPGGLEVANQKNWKKLFKL